MRAHGGLERRDRLLEEDFAARCGASKFVVSEGKGRQGGRRIISLGFLLDEAALEELLCLLFLPENEHLVRFRGAHCGTGTSMSYRYVYATQDD